MSRRAEIRQITTYFVYTNLFTLLKIQLKVWSADRVPALKISPILHKGESMPWDRAYGDHFINKGKAQMRSEDYIYINISKKTSVLGRQFKLWIDPVDPEISP